MNANSALVLFSGGQDSTTCLAWALARFALVETVGFDYGQRHRTELGSAPGQFVTIWTGMTIAEGGHGSA